MSKVILHSFGSIEIDAGEDRAALTQDDSEDGAQQILVARDQLPSLIRLLQAVEREGAANG